MKLEIIKQRIDAPSRKLNAKWSLEYDYFEDVRKKPETEEEEADEIIRRLKAPPRKKRNNTDIETETMYQFAKQIAAEIEKEIIIDVYGQGKNRTR